MTQKSDFKNSLIVKKVEIKTLVLSSTITPFYSKPFTLFFLLYYPILCLSTPCRLHVTPLLVILPPFLHFSLLLFSFMSYLTISFFCVLSYVLFTCLHSSASYFSSYLLCPHLPIGIQMSQCSRWTERLKRCVSSTLQY